MRRGAFLVAPLAALVFLGAPASGGTFIRGDANSDGVVDVSDAVHVLGFLFLGGPPPGCEDSADANDDGRLDVADATTLLAHLFLGGPKPPFPGPEWKWYDATPADPFNCGDFAAEMDLAPDEIFERLTGSRWSRSSFWEMENYCFRRDGRYHSKCFSDVWPPLEDQGLWNFAQTSPGGGIIDLSGGDALRFSLLADGTLQIRNMILDPSASADCGDETEDCSFCTRRDLPPVGVSDVVEALASRPWWKADDFDRYSMPDSFEFGVDGRYRAVFRAGECVFESYWSLNGSDLLLEIQGKSCDLRPLPEWPWPIYLGYTTLWQDGALRLNPDYQEYIAGDRPSDEGRFAVKIGSTQLGDLAFLRGVYTRPLTRGPKEFRFRLQVGADREFPSMQFRISKRGFKWTPKGPVPEKEEVLLSKLDLPKLDPGAFYEYPQELDLGDGDFWLNFSLGDDPTLWLFPWGFTVSR